MSNFFTGKSFEYAEPVHPASFRLHENLIKIYLFIKNNLQKDIDKVFDSTSEKIGLVITTSLPAQMQISDKKIKEFKTVLPENSKETLYHEDMKKILAGFQGKSLDNVSDGTYDLYVFWHDALKAKLKTAWMEPVHFNTMVKTKLPPLSWVEPAHWFDPRIELSLDERIFISALDEVYTDLQLENRLVSIRKNLYEQIIAVQEPAQKFQAYEPFEPAQFQNRIDNIQIDTIKKALSEISDVIKKYNL